MKKLLITTAIVLAVTASQAQVIRWGGDYLAGGDSNFANANSWTVDGVNPAGVPTSVASHALIGNLNGGFGPIIMPVVSTDVGSDLPFTVGVGWDESYGELTLAPGGSMVVNNELRVGWGGSVTSTGQVTVVGGSIIAGNLYLGSGGDNRATVHVTSGFFHAGTVHLETGARIEIGDTGKFHVNGDMTGLGLIGTILFPVNAGETVVESYNGTSLTTFEVIPEPATFGLMALVGGGMMWVRRRFTS